jgi:ABC-type dipeptide/oligopeptide/nickel transport system permease component
VATLVFALIDLVPGDPVQALLGDSATPQDIVDLPGRLGLGLTIVSVSASVGRCSAR